MKPTSKEETNNKRFSDYVLQWVAVCFTALCTCVAVCCSVLQFSVLQCCTVSHCGDVGVLHCVAVVCCCVL